MLPSMWGNEQEFLRYCAEHPDDAEAWNMFYDAFDEFIILISYRETERYFGPSGFQSNGPTVQDVVQDTYFKLVKDDCEVLKRFRGDSFVAFRSFLAVMIRNLVGNHKTAANAAKRPKIDPGPNSQDNEYLERQLFDLSYRQKNLESLRDETVNYKMLYLDVKKLLDEYAKLDDQNARNALIAKYYFLDDLPVSDIAENYLSDIKEKTISNNISMMKQYLKKNLGG